MPVVPGVLHLLSCQRWLIPLAGGKDKAFFWDNALFQGTHALNFDLFPAWFDFY
mgnify:CR=1 FL=1